MSLKLTPSIIFLIAANAVPVFGVLFWGWDALGILVLYWLESVIIGLLNIPKILASRTLRQKGIMSVIGNLYLAVFFTFHYGMFTAGHGLFLSEALGARPIMEGLLNGGPIIWTAVTFLISHAFSMMYNFFGKKEYLDQNSAEQMFSVYGRVIVMHVVIIVGGFAVQSFGSPVIAVIMLIILKTGIDLIAHKKEHKVRKPVTS